MVPALHLAELRPLVPLSRSNTGHTGIPSPFLTYLFSPPGPFKYWGLAHVIGFGGFLWFKGLWDSPSRGGFWPTLCLGETPASSKGHSQHMHLHGATKQTILTSKHSIYTELVWDNAVLGLQRGAVFTVFM